MYTVGRARSAWPLGAWLMFAVLLVGAGVGVVVGIISPGLALDLVSLWPGLVPALLAGAILPWWRGRPPRAMALPPLLAFTWLVLAGAAHFSGWDPLPSSAVELWGPSTGSEQAALVVEPGGLLRVVAGSSSDPVYRVTWVRQAGEVGVPAATEIAHPELLQIRVEDRGTTTFHRYAGWELTLDPLTTWGLVLGGAEVEARLDQLLISSLTLNGAGSVVLGEADGSVQVLVTGDFTVSVPSGRPAEMRGEGTVPADWLPVDGGMRAPVEGDGWLIVPEAGATIEIITP
jgi:hypothetical protein